LKSISRIEARIHWLERQMLAASRTGLRDSGLKLLRPLSRKRLLSLKN
jgi:hypothetical protein